MGPPHRLDHPCQKVCTKAKRSSQHRPTKDAKTRYLRQHGVPREQRRQPDRPVADANRVIGLLEARDGALQRSRLLINLQVVVRKVVDRRPPAIGADGSESAFGCTGRVGECVGSQNVLAKHLRVPRRSCIMRSNRNVSNRCVCAGRPGRRLKPSRSFPEF